jgi:ABC-type dipeptide/oligopeptide/nickel transport system permease subunit
LNDGKNHLLDAPYLTIFPGLAIFISVLAFNLLGDALRDKLDPRFTQ